MNKLLNKILLAFVLICSISIGNVVSAASVITVTPYGTPPTSLPSGSTTAAYYTVQNAAVSLPSTAFLSVPTLPGMPGVLPATISQTTTGGYCDTRVTWVSGSSCILKLAISGAVSNFKPGVCLNDNQTCGFTTTPLNVAVVTLSSITVTPPSPSVAAGLTKQFTATATYSDGSTADITGSVTWTSSSTAAATIGSSTGLATSVAVGSTTIKATDPTTGKYGSTTLTVTAATLATIAVTPPDATIAPAATKSYTATGTYSDGSTADITPSVTWTPGNTGVATMAANVATGVANGRTTITATDPGSSVSGQTTLTVQSITYAYVPNSYTQGVSSVYAITKCQRNATTGVLLGSCTSYSSPGSAWNPTGIDFATVGGTTRAYVSSNSIANSGQSTVFMCDTAFSSCAATPVAAPLWNNPNGILFITPTGGSKYAYVPDVGLTSPGSAPRGGVYQCTLSNNGTFSACPILSGWSGSVSFNSPSSIALTTVSSTQYVYITDGGKASPTPVVLPSVSFCSLNTNGTFNVCADTAGSNTWSAPYGIAFATVTNGQFAYVADGANVKKCPVNSNGTFGTCAPETVPMPKTYKGISIQTVNSTQYAYLSERENGMVGNVYKCPIDGTTGEFGSCTATPSSSVPTWDPNGNATFAS
jgi:hypothetical protein